MSLKNNKDEIKSQIILNISEESFMIHHSDDLDLLDVYLVLQSALEYIEDAAKSVAQHEGNYLQ